MSRSTEAATAIDAQRQLEASAAMSRAPELLLQGVDRRGDERYGLPMLADEGLVHFGSCTANPITPSMAQRHREWLVRVSTHAGIQTPTHAVEADLGADRWLQLYFGAAHCRLAASGTDAEYTCAMAMGPEPFCSVLADPAEIGSGCLAAASGLAHAAAGPVEAPLPLRVQTATIRLRDEAGCALPGHRVEEQLQAVAARHATLPLLVHHVPCTKTGLIAPTEAACLALQQTHPCTVRVVVDASQGRCSLQDVRRWLGHGWAVIITGSKFLGAPPFCGATLLPAGWPPARAYGAGPGVQARWRLAFDALPQPPVTPAWSALLQHEFVPRLPAARFDADGPTEGAADRQGICSFDVGLDAGRTRRLHRRLIADGYFIGQPVTAGPRQLLRVALGAHTDLRRAAQDLRGLAAAITHALRHG